MCDRIAETVKEEEETPEEKKVRIENSYAKIREYIGNGKDTNEEYDKISGERNYYTKRLLVAPKQEENAISDEIHMSRDSSKENGGDTPESKEAEQDRSTRPKEKEGIVEFYDSLIANVEKEKAEALRRNDPRLRRGSREKPDVKTSQDCSTRLEDEGVESRHSMRFPTLDTASSGGKVKKTWQDRVVRKKARKMAKELDRMIAEEEGDTTANFLTASKSKKREQ